MSLQFVAAGIKAIVEASGNTTLTVYGSNLSPLSKLANPSTLILVSEQVRSSKEHMRSISQESLCNR